MCIRDRVETLTCLPCMEALPGLCEGGVEGLCRKLEAALKTRRKKHPDLEENLRRDIERLRDVYKRQADGLLLH